MLNFVIAVVRQYNISPTCVRVAVIRYSNTADAPIRLTSYSDVSSLVQAIGQLQLLGGSVSNVHLGLILLLNQVFASNVVRPNAVLIAIIVTDHLSEPSNLITTAANNAKSRGITLVGVAITGPQRVNVNYFFTIVSNRWLVQVGDYSQLISGARDIIVRRYGCFPYTTTPSPITATCIVKFFGNNFYQLSYIHQQSRPTTFIEQHNCLKNNSFIKNY